MSPADVIAHSEQYEADLSGILARFTRTRDGIHIDHNDDPRYRQIVQELVDLFTDALGRNQYSRNIANIANEGVSNFTHSPSFKSVEDIISVFVPQSRELGVIQTWSGNSPKMEQTKQAMSGGFCTPV